MTRLKAFNHYSILLWWAEETSDGQRDLKNVAANAKMHQVDPRDLTLPNIRRYIPRLLRRHGYLPRNRPPTKYDYQLAKERFLEWWFTQELV